MKHWQMRSVRRDPKTKQILGYGRPRTFPPKIGQLMLDEAPQEWEVIDAEFDVPDDDRYLSLGGNEMERQAKGSWKQQSITAEALAGSAPALPPVQRPAGAALRPK